MWGIIVLSLSFALAVVGFVQSNRASRGSRRVLGLTRWGLALVALCMLGFVAGMVKEVKDGLAEKNRDAALIDIQTSLRALQERAASSEMRRELGKLADRISSAYLSAREADFSRSDFSGSNFTEARFFGTNFASARFDGANLRGADLGLAILDSTTRLPHRPSENAGPPVRPE